MRKPLGVKFDTLLKTAFAAIFMMTVASCSESSQENHQANGDTGTKEAAQNAAQGLVPFDKYELANGLTVIMHTDRSDPVVAVALTAHVGSAREKAGRTGFAHLFEHLLFLESENLGKGGLDKLSARIGGSGANGSTSRDRTNYFQTVPKDALEKMLWAEADKLGWFINTVTEPVLAKEKQVVKNEKRQSVDNRAYGHAQYVADKALYPEGHPYNWQVIGSLEDLDAATLDDVKDFFRRWYVPNNVILTISGDFDTAQAKQWVEKYFAEIPRGPEIPLQEKQPGRLEEIKNYYWEDNFARQPELRMTWPTVPVYHKDSYPLAVLRSLLTDGKDTPFNKILVDDLKLTTSVGMFPYESEIAGQLILQVRAVDGTNLNTVIDAVDQAFAEFEANGIDERDLDRIKTEAEAAFYDGIGSVLGKGFNLATYQIYTKDPGYIDTDLARIKSVTSEDVMRVYREYIKDKPYVATSFVPKGQTDLSLAGAELAAVEEEQIVAGAETAVDPNVVAEYERTPSSFDRTIEPPYGETLTLPVPVIWQHQFDNGLQVLGSESSETPTVRFSLIIEGGQLLDSLEKPGMVNFVAEMLNKGTQSKTTAELEDTLKSLGASVAVSANPENITFSGATLARNFDEVMSIVAEMVLEPRWDEDEFALTKIRISDQLVQQLANPNALANSAFRRAIYGENHILARNILGTSESVAAITLDDLKQFFNNNLSSHIAKLHVVGDTGKDQTIEAAQRLAAAWQSKDVVIPEYGSLELPTESKIYFYDVPGAKQSILRLGYPALEIDDEQYYPAFVMNYILGGGSFASRLTQQLREGKGYTYGIGSGFIGLKNSGYFQIGSGVRSNITLEAVDLVKSIMEEYPSTFSEADLAVTKSFLSKSQTRTFETQSAKLNMLTNISMFGFPADYAQLRADYVANVSLEDIRELANRYIRPDAMHYVIAGDATTQMNRLKDLGFGDPILLNPPAN